MWKGFPGLWTGTGSAPGVCARPGAWLACAPRGEPACFLLDIHLGGMSGIDLRRRLAASGSTAPVIFMTAFDDDATREEAIAAGCIAYLHKPFPAHSLIGAIAKAG